LVATAPAAIACVGRLETAALQAATHTIPIVFMMAPDPVEFGFVASLARPGGNTTGFTQISAELDAKRLEVLHEVAPTLSRAAFLINPSFLPRVEERFASAEAMAKRLGITLQRVVATRPSELTAAFAAIQETVSEGLLIQNDPMFGMELQRIIDFAAGHRLPTVFEGSLAAKKGGLATYGIDGVENARLAAGYIARILKGEKPADLPVQQPTRFEFVINLKTAKALGLTVPQTILARANEVIE